MTHLCPARRCPREVPDHLLMCGIHWRQVPAPLQRAVNAAYDHGRGLGTLALAAAQTDAITAVNGAPPPSYSAPPRS
jgi:hypothetical protein